LFECTDWFACRDDDIDVQMCVQDVFDLIKYNQTVIDGSFLLDVNANLVYRNYMEKNVIDARVIDMECGVFLDIF
jgi:hypothetical protein